MRGAQLFFSCEVVDDLPGQLLLLVADAGIDRQAIADLPRVLDEEVDVVLQRRPRDVEVGAGDAVDPAEVDVGEDRDRWRRSPSAGRRARGTSARCTG